jgi:hypothetical protein
MRGGEAVGGGFDCRRQQPLAGLAQRLVHIRA